MTLDRERDFAAATARKIGALCAKIQSELVSEETVQKKDRSPVTVADYTAQALVALDLAEQFPSDPLMAEEHASGLDKPENAKLRESIIDRVRGVRPGLEEERIFTAINSGGCEGGFSGRFWALDPIDGTKGFLRGGQYAVALALLEDGVPILGAMGCPNLRIGEGPKGCVLFAARGEGAFIETMEGSQPRRVKVRDNSDPSAAIVFESFDPSHASQDDSALVSEALGIRTEPVRIDSQCKYSLVAAGEADIYLRLPGPVKYDAKLWDHAAGWMILKEAGGEATDVHGKPLDFGAGRTLRKNVGTVVTSGRIHADVLSAVAKVLKV